MANLFGIGLSGLKSAQTQLSVTGQNITNVNTPGYTRQTAVQTAQVPSFTGAGYMGNGTKVVDVDRIYNQFLTNQVRTATSTNAEVQAFKSQLEQLNTLVSSSATGITPGLQSYFDALQTAIEDPANLPARQLFLSEAEGLAARFNTVQTSLSSQNQFIGQQMGTLADQASRLASSIASYNDSIAVAAANGAQPNDLLDARDEAVRELSELIGVTVVQQDDNMLNIFIGSGQPLVVGNQASTLAVQPGAGDPSRVDVVLKAGNAVQDVTGLISGGELGGLIKYRNDVLDPALNAIGRLALSIASEFNEQQGQGLDLNGNAGASLFNDINSAELVDGRSLARATNSDPNAKLDVLISDTSQLSTSDYEVVFTSATEFTVRRTSDDSVSGPYDLNSVPPPELDGFTIELGGGGIAAGDRFLLTPTRHAAAEMTVVMQQPQELAFAAPGSVEASLDNRGTGSLSQPSLTAGPSPIDSAALQGLLPVELSYDEASGELQVTGGTATLNPSPLVITPGQTNSVEVTVGGYTFSMSMTGTPKDGDSFNLAFNAGVADNRNALVMSGLQTAKVLGQANGAEGFSFVDGYGDLVQRVATYTAQARTNSESSAAVLTQATNNRDSVSAVSLDEEAANLIKFEQYYNASAQVIQVARTIFDTLINSVR
ncbi:flagellar hook-associated protein FlgK [Halopseudomonas maritima]|uniref:flagellar hook-associated protein FlgK n=1 Tax=Halopseudomonas maritima TaxID=2918528 RepID=UPI001EECD4E7|nr:flagellar hook-associated protein FlgK [Halopseudomonas maritima]UJJ32138.1 flagellar hook-associated protein FlgK [Halopseudomonas maritima]